MWKEWLTPYDQKGDDGASKWRAGTRETEVGLDVSSIWAKGFMLMIVFVLSDLT